jgi:hypothetical protein
MAGRADGEGAGSREDGRERERAEVADPDEQSRVWSHRLHEDLIFNDRQNFFLLAQSMLAVAFANALQADHHRVGQVIAALALVLTVVWTYVAARHRKIVEIVHDRALELLPEFHRTYETRKLRGPSSTKLLAWSVPPAIGVMWVALLWAA